MISTVVSFSKRKKSPIVLFGLSLILCFTSCKTDHPQIPDSEKSLEDIYFEDYESPRDLWTFIDKSGKELFKPQYDNLRDFYGGLAIANKKGKWGVITPANKVVVPFQYKEISCTQKGIFVAKDFTNNYHVIDGENKPLLDSIKAEQIYPTASGAFRFKRNGTWGILNSAGNEIIEARYSSIQDIENGHYIAGVNENEQLLNPSGDIIYEGSDLEWLRQDLLLDQELYKFRLIKIADGKSEEIFKEYGEASYNGGSAVMFYERDVHRYYDFESKLFTTTAYQVRDPLGEGLWSFYDQKFLGTLKSKTVVVHNPKYNVIYPFTENRAVVGKNDLWGYIDPDGKEIIPLKYYLAWSFKNGMARVFTENGIAFIDTTGQIILPGNPNYLELKDFQEGYARVQKRASVF